MSTWKNVFGQRRCLRGTLSAPPPNTIHILYTQYATAHSLAKRCLFSIYNMNRQSVKYIFFQKYRTQYLLEGREIKELCFGWILRISHIFVSAEDVWLKGEACQNKPDPCRSLLRLSPFKCGKVKQSMQSVRFISNV